MSDNKKWYENIPAGVILCRKKGGSVRLINFVSNELGFFLNGVDLCHGIPLVELTPITAAEWWDFAPWRTMDSAPRDGSEILLLFGNRVILTNCADYSFWTEKENFHPIKWLPLPDMVCIRTPRKGSKEARDIVAMLGKQARIAKNLQARELGWKFLKDFYGNGGIKNYGVVIFESAKSMLHPA
jgi:hypothetical protein